jgi:hypothetical protein
MPRALIESQDHSMYVRRSFGKTTGRVMDRLCIERHRVTPLPDLNTPLSSLHPDHSHRVSLASHPSARSRIASSSVLTRAFSVVSGFLRTSLQ